MSLYSVKFNGGYVNVANVLGFAKTDPFSLVAWLKYTATDNDYYLAKMLSGSPYTGWGVSITSGSPRFELYASDSTVLRVRTSATFNDDGWHHVIWTYDGSELASGVTCYVDGSSEALSTLSDNLTGTITNSTNLNIGSYGNGTQPWVGSLDEVGVYDKELSSGESSDIYSGGVPVALTGLSSAANLVGWWRMGDGDTYPTLTDNSTNSNDGTMTSMSASDIVPDNPEGKVPRSQLITTVPAFGNRVGAAETSRSQFLVTSGATSTVFTYFYRAWNTNTVDWEFWDSVGSPDPNPPSGDPITGLTLLDVRAS